MMIIGILMVFLLEQLEFTIKFRKIVYTSILKYIQFFINKDFKYQKEIRFAYVLAIIPILAILISFKIFLTGGLLILFKLLLLISFIQILSWKKEAKHTSKHNKNFTFIETFAVNFFAPLFWYWVLPCGIGMVTYVMVMIISEQFKHKNLDSVVYNVVVDKMMFYVNFIPYCLLYIFIALAGDFEHVSHYLLNQRKNFTKGFYFLNRVLYDVILIAINRDNYEETLHEYYDGVESGITPGAKLSVDMVPYIVAVLYRAGLFFLMGIGLFTIAHFFGLIAR